MMLEIERLFVGGCAARPGDPAGATAPSCQRARYLIKSARIAPANGIGSPFPRQVDHRGRPSCQTIRRRDGFRRRQTLPRPASSRPRPPPGQPGGYGQPGPYGAPYGSPHGAPYGAPWAMPVHKPGVVALRPLKLGDFFDGAFKTIRRNPKAMVGLAALVSTVAMVIPVLLTWLLAAGGNLSFDLGGTSDGELPGFGTGAVSVVSNLGGLFGAIATVVLNGMLVRVVPRPCSAARPRSAEAWAAVRGRLLRLFGLTLLNILLALLVFAIPVAIAVVVGVRSSLGAAFAVGVPLLLLGLRRVHLRAGPVLPARPACPGARARRCLRRRCDGPPRLSRHQFWRLFGITLLTQLVVGPCRRGHRTPPGPGRRRPRASSSVAPAGALALVFSSYLSQIILGAITTPFTSGVVALQYVDQRIRKEGLDVSLIAASQQPSGDPRLTRARRPRLAPRSGHRPVLGRAGAQPSEYHAEPAGTGLRLAGSSSGTRLQAAALDASPALDCRSARRGDPARGRARGARRLPRAARPGRRHRHGSRAGGRPGERRRAPARRHDRAGVGSTTTSPSSRRSARSRPGPCSAGSSRSGPDSPRTSSPSGSSPSFPDHAAALAEASAKFDLVFYGDLPATGDDARSVLELDDALRLARPARVTPGEPVEHPVSIATAPAAGRHPATSARGRREWLRRNRGITLIAVVIVLVVARAERAHRAQRDPRRGSRPRQPRPVRCAGRGPGARPARESTSPSYDGRRSLATAAIDPDTTLMVTSTDNLGRVTAAQVQRRSVTAGQVVLAAPGPTLVEAFRLPLVPAAALVSHGHGIRLRRPARRRPVAGRRAVRRLPRPGQRRGGVLPR